MKYIELPALSRLAQSLTHEGPECDVHTRIEAYSCKQIKRDKKLFKSLETAYQEDVSNSPPLPSWMALDKEAEMTPFGPIDRQASRKTLYFLIATLNVAFPDHDFSDVRPSHFVREESGASVLNALSNTLVSPHRAGSNAPRSYSSYPPASSDIFPSSISSSTSPYDKPIPSPLAPPPIVSGTHPTLFRIINEVIGLPDCEVYSYNPEIDADPHANDFDDDDDDVASVADENSSGDDDPTFEFDNYDVDELRPTYRRTAIPPPTPRAASQYTIPDDFSPISYERVQFKRRGALLWSSHWFFLNRKLKRILFVTVWARSKGIGRFYVDDEDEYYGVDARDDTHERFLGWEGSIGAGARALGLKGY
ncbi:MAF1 protein [Coprinopsis cinerea okayama7|uniref:MAF1 protein n=1 Tax=Coprinopsis cinerea (strain Okayama-7 / 130 / ATCC MYA-4618 / FGSC 9003) TaxID=240176 RepID=A8NTC0_COPC7|nr:MAF1 protein [Coprinopsis cinerea okayama7\|eukprot:XP_001836192.1 MAF1 protein [Coprinopsis cinerea okayama7\